MSLAESGFTSLAELKADDGNGEITLTDLLELTVGPTGVDSTVYVNFYNGSTEDGASPETGFNTLLEGVAFVSSGGTVILSPVPSPEVLSISKPVTLQSSGIGAQLGVIE